MNRRLAAASIGLTFLLAACRGAESPGAPFAPEAVPRAAAQELYVVNSINHNITVYSLGSAAPKLSRTIVPGNPPSAVAVDARGTLYALTRKIASNATQSFIAVYSPGATKPAYTFRACDANDLALWRGDLYVAVPGSAGGTCGPRINVYAPGGKTPTRSITNGITVPTFVKIDPSGNLYAYDNGYPGTFVEYGPGGSSPLRTLQNASDLFTLDADGNVYASVVANDFCPNCPANHVSKWSPQNANPVLTLKRGIPNPSGLAVDAAGTLYVVNRQTDGHTNVVVEFAKGTRIPARTIRNGIESVLTSQGDMALDGAGNLYVANYSASSTYFGNVVVYRPGATKPLYTVTAGINHPIGIVIGR